MSAVDALLLERIERWWGQKQGLAWGAALCVLLALTIGDTFQNKALIAATAFAVLFAFWSNSHWSWWGFWRSKKLRVVIGMYCDDLEVEKGVEEDFSRELRILINRGNLAKDVEIVRPTRAECMSLESDVHYEQLLERKRAHMFICGRVRKRQTEGGENLFLSFRAGVRHAALEKKLCEEFSKEMSSVFPTGILRVPTSEQLPQLKITADWIAVSTRYILSLAAGVSGDLAYAEKMLEDAINLLPRLTHDVRKRTKLQERLETRLRELYVTQANRAFIAWRSSRDSVDALAAKTAIENAMKLGEKRAAARHLQATAAYVLTGDACAAERALRHSIYDHPSLFASLAFVCAMQGKYVLARKLYRDVWKKSPDEDLLEQLKTFFDWHKQAKPDLYNQTVWCESVLILERDGKTSEFKKISNYLLKQKDFPDSEKAVIRKSMSE